jgi:hypothetical protein
MTAIPILIVADALRHARSDPAYRRTVDDQNTPTTSWPKSTTAGLLKERDITVEEFEATRRRLAQGAYRAVRTRGTHPTTPNSSADLVLRRTIGLKNGLKNGLDTVLRRLGMRDAAGGDAHARGLAWVVPIHDEQDRARLNGLDPAGTFALRIRGVLDGRVADPSLMRRADEAVRAVMSMSMGTSGCLSFLTATSCSPARLSATGDLPEGPVGSATTTRTWRTLPVDPDLAAMLPPMLCVSSERDVGTGHDTPRPCFRSIHFTMKKDERLDPMQALRILAELKRNPLT